MVRNKLVILFMIVFVSSLQAMQHNVGKSPMPHNVEKPRLRITSQEMRELKAGRTNILMTSTPQSTIYTANLPSGDRLIAELFFATGASRYSRRRNGWEGDVSDNTGYFNLIEQCYLRAMGKAQLAANKETLTTFLQNRALGQQAIIHFFDDMQAKGLGIRKRATDLTIKYSLVGQNSSETVSFLAANELEPEGKYLEQRRRACHEQPSDAKKRFDLFRLAYEYQEALKQEKQEDQKEENE
ncbi:MAG TPA: hypothetical protein VGT41_06635 [Candidatus Babeliales bacterium]|nr:hypothetical protein [Candidatus Babeliales bacterium]